MNGDASGVSDVGDVCVLIPTLNESDTIYDLVKEFQEYDCRVVVIDGNSTDDTRELAREAGAEVIIQTGKGKGQAVTQAFSTLEDEYLVMLDGDGTYLSCEVDVMLAPILSGRADHVIGNRFANFSKGAFTKLNLFGNRVLNWLFCHIYGVCPKDILSGYRAFNKNAYKAIELNKTGFEIETEITVECVKKGMRIEVVPITYLARQGDAQTKLNPLRDGFKIGMTIQKLAKWFNPKLYFMVPGVLFTLSGVSVGIYVVNEWLNNVTHVPLTILATLLVTIGLQLLIFAMIADMIATLHHETLREFRYALQKGR